jgi:hypothetical protein
MNLGLIAMSEWINDEMNLKALGLHEVLMSLT